MDLDPVVALAMSIHSSPGIFALLVGSGISRNAQVPTGWDVVVDLIRKVAELTDGETPTDPVAWFREKDRGDPNYSTILETLARTPADRRNLLNRYFERSADETDPSVKKPTRAHRAIAQLVSAGFIRVILTTNFDRLLETAVREAGVEPVVISSPSAAAGATPLAHTRCTVVKLHGDYLDPDLKNTVDELGSYDPAIDRLLDRVFDEYGLVVCGWSGEWDEALRNALLRAPGRRYGTYWARLGPLGERAMQLVAHRQAVEVPIQGADEFFEDLASKVSALDEGLNRRPLSAALAVAELKRYLPDPVHRIRLHDLIMSEVSRAMAVPSIGGQPSVEPVSGQMHRYEDGSSLLVPLLATMAAFSDRPEHDSLLVDAFRRLATRHREHSGYTLWIEMQLYPALLALYSIGLGATAARRLSPLVNSLSNIEVHHPNGALKPAVAVASSRVLDASVCNALVAPASKRKTPVSDYLHDLLREPLRSVLPSDDEYSDAFDDLEYILGVACTAVRGRGPIGRFVWRRDSAHPSRPESHFVEFADALLDAGMFEGERAKLDEAQAAYEKAIEASGLAR